MSTTRENVQIKEAEQKAFIEKMDSIITSRKVGFTQLFRELVYEMRDEGQSQADRGETKELANLLETPFSKFLFEELSKGRGHIVWMDKASMTFKIRSETDLAKAYSKVSKVRVFKNRSDNVIKRVKNALTENVKSNILNQLGFNTYQFKFKSK